VQFLLKAFGDRNTWNKKNQGKHAIMRIPQQFINETIIMNSAVRM
jgi:hypothetical protein